MAVCQQGIYVEYSMEYSKCRALKVEGLFGRRLRGLAQRNMTSGDAPMRAQINPWYSEGR
eukprot:9392633-Pyramimonas_sp.AAC.1